MGKVFRGPDGAVHGLKFEVREAKPSDKAPLMAFIKDVWGGHDYIPQVWDEWIRDRGAKMFVVEGRGRPVAMNRVRFLQDGSAWFEGVRVHPEYRRMGLATMLGDNAMKVAARRGAKVYRLTSSSRNRAAHAQVAGMGFRERARFSVYEPGDRMKFRPQAGVRRGVRADFSLVKELALRSEEYRAGGGLMWEGIVAFALTDGVIRAMLGQGSVFVTDGALAVYLPSGEGKEVWSEIGFLAGDPGKATRLIRHIFATVGKKGWRPILVPQGSPLVGALRKEGFKRTFALRLFERLPAKG
jgi:ribosomal protein S18 acetylase RimI-like enzyme